MVLVGLEHIRKGGERQRRLLFGTAGRLIVESFKEYRRNLLH